MAEEPFDVIYAAVHAFDRTGQIGCGKCPRGLPWSKEGGTSDMRWFMRRARGSVVIVGRKTAELMGRPITGARAMVVLTRRGESSVGGFYPASSLDRALALAIEMGDGLAVPLVAGGADVIDQALAHPGCSKVYHSQISPAHRTCDHSEGDRTYSKHYGPFALAALGFHPTWGPAVIDDNVFRIYGRRGPPTIRVILLYGPIGVGKSTIAGHMRDAGWKTESFAAPLKEICAALIGGLRPELLETVGGDPRAAMDRKMVRGDPEQGQALVDRREIPLGPRPVEFRDGSVHPLSVRTLLQFVGTEVLRPALGDEVFARALIPRFIANGATVVDDLRFCDEHVEVCRCLARGVPADTPAPYSVVLVEVRGGPAPPATHRSETERGRFAPDLVLRNGHEDVPGATAGEMLGSP
jgi:dihydrofolate reductase